ncbi:MAG TPA: hypothetical protein VE964_10755 [Myxococcales bacterium]|nr:hypothetical protein [Myxococcales bacterium]
MNRIAFRRAGSLLALALAAACGGSSLEKLDAQAPDVPYVNQYNPAGKYAGYDGSEYCGPALLAGIAKERGQSGGLSDAALVGWFAALAGTNDVGTTGNGMIAALEWMGMRTDANRGGDLDWIDDELASGHDVIANGDFYALPAHQRSGFHSGHYVAITAARGGWSSYTVTDPAGGIISLSDLQLQTFIESHPQGGFTISAW